jgi:hypothetical protein
MSRPRADGSPAQPVNKHKLNDRFVASQKAAGRDRLTWDSNQPGLALCVRATGRKSWKVVYRHHGRPVWLHLGDARSIGLADARRLTAKVMLAVAEGKDPAAERKATRMPAASPISRLSTSSCTPSATTSPGARPSISCSAT